MFKKLFSFLIVLSMTFVLFTGLQISVSAEEPTSGSCGDNLTWSIDYDSHLLTISGTGDMYNYSDEKEKFHPWNGEYIGSVVISSGVTSIGDYAFLDCELDSVTISDTVKYIGHGAFANCPDLTSVTIPNSVTAINSSTFKNCVRLTSVIIPNSVTKIDIMAFDGCSSLTSVTIPNSVNTIRLLTFSGCSNLTSIEIPESVTSIEDNAFKGCSNLTSVTIPQSVTFILNRAFYNCTNLETVFYSDNCRVNRFAFDGTNATQIKYKANGRKLTITDIIPNGDETSVTIGKMDGQTADTIIYKSGLTVSGDIVSPTTTKIEYTEEDGKITISKIEVPNGVKAEIPATINGKPVVAVAESYQGNVGNHTHTGGTATCEKKAECTLCGEEYGDFAAHNYADGVCGVCKANDPDYTPPTETVPMETSPTETEPTETSPTETASTGTSPTGTAPSIPSRPSYPSSPAFTTAAAETTTVTVTTAEEIIADGDYTGEDVSVDAGIYEDDRDISEKSMGLIVFTIAAVIVCAVLIKKIVF